MTFLQVFITVAVPCVLFAAVAYVTEFAWKVKDHNKAIDALKRVQQPRDVRPWVRPESPLPWKAGEWNA